MRFYRPSRTGQPLLVVAVGLTLLLSGCSAESGTVDDDGYTGADWASELPACDELWVEGSTLPEEYLGCVDAQGLDLPRSETCSSGNGDLVVHEELFAREGGKVAAGAEDSAAYEQALAQCSPAGS